MYRQAQVRLLSLLQTPPHTYPVGLLKPNGFGLFDIHGNATQWCQDAYELDNKVDKDSLVLSNEQRRVKRGSEFDDGSTSTESTRRTIMPPGDRPSFGGFRVARTYR